MSEPLRLSTFTPLVGESFSVERAAGQAVELRLASVTPAGRPRPTGPDGTPDEGFSLCFAGPDTEPLSQATYWFAHPAIGRQEIFVVPVGREPDGLLYEAVFN